MFATSSDAGSLHASGAAKQQVGEDETIAFYDHTGVDSERMAEHRSRRDAGVKLAAFTARVGAGRQFREELLIERSPGQFRGHHSRVDAGQTRLQPTGNHLARERWRRTLPEREDRCQAASA